MALVAFVIPVVDTLRGAGPASWLSGNYLTQSGIGGNLAAGVRPDLFPTWIWLILNLLAAIGGVLLCAVSGFAAVEVAKRRSSRECGLLAVFLALEGAGVVGYPVLIGNALDRYLWPLIVPSGILILHLMPPTLGWSRFKTSSGVVAIVFTGLACVAASLVWNSDLWDAARWNTAATTARQMGVGPQLVDGGYEWVAYYGDHVHKAPGPPVAGWWLSAFEDIASCAVISSSQLADPGLTIAGPVTYRFLGMDIGPTLFVYRARSCRG